MACAGESPRAPARDDPALWATQLEAASPRERTQAASHLGSMGDTARGAIPALRRQLTDTSDNAASTAAWALAHIRGPADSVLLEALQDSNPRVRRLAAYALGEAGPGIEGASDALSRARQAEPDSGVRAMITWAQGQMGGRKLRDLNMVRGLQSPDSTERREAVRRLAASGVVSSDVLEILIRTLGSSDSLLRDGAAQALGRIGEPARYALQGALRDPNPAIRDGAANVLARGKTSGF